MSSLQKFFMKDDNYRQKYEDKIKSLQGLVEQYKAEGINPKRAKAMAEMKTFLPEHLEDVKKYYTLSDEFGKRIPIILYADDQEQFDLVRKFFKLNKCNNAPDSALFIDILKYLDSQFPEAGE